MVERASGAMRSTKRRSWLLAVDGSPRRRMFMSPRRCVPAEACGPTRSVDVCGRLAAELSAFTVCEIPFAAPKQHEKKSSFLELVSKY